MSEITQLELGEMPLREPRSHETLLNFGCRKSLRKGIASGTGGSHFFGELANTRYCFANWGEAEIEFPLLGRTTKIAQQSKSIGPGKLKATLLRREVEFVN